MLDKRLLQSSRFHLDDPGQFGFPVMEGVGGSEKIYSRFMYRHVQVSKILFPALAKVVESTTELLLGEKKVHAFISADESQNATCIPGPNDLPIIWLSSGLIKGLKENELRFVIGHELGHWLYEHYRYPPVEPDGGPRFVARQQLARAAEISADRIGLIACEDIDVALRAIVKTASGLDEKHIGARVSEFIAQARTMSIGEIDSGEVFATHPPMVVRARALLWFSMSRDFVQLSGNAEGALEMDLVNRRVERDLESVLGEQFSKRQREEIEDALLWMTLYEVLADGTLTKEEQRLIHSEFGAEILKKVKTFVSGKSTTQVGVEIREKAEAARVLISAYPKHKIERLVNTKTSIAEHAMKFMHRFN